MRSKLLFAIADTLGMQLEFTAPDFIIGGKNKCLPLLDHKHTHRVVVLSSMVVEKKFAAVGVRIIGDMGMVVIAEDYDNVPVTAVFVDMRKVDLQKMFKGGKVKSVSDIKSLVSPGAKAMMTRDASPVANNDVRKWACTA